MKQYHTYLHRGHDGRVFYVGCASSYIERETLLARYQRAYSNSGHMPAWYEAAGKGYTVEIIEHFTERAAAFVAERALIQKMRECGEPLVNICDGGPGIPGAKDSDEVRRKKSITKLGALNPFYGKRTPIARKVIGDGVEYASVSDAATALGLKMKTLYNMLSGHRPNRTSLRFA